MHHTGPSRLAAAGGVAAGVAAGGAGGPAGGGSAAGEKEAGGVVEPTLGGEAQPGLLARAAEATHELAERAAGKVAHAAQLAAGARPGERRRGIGCGAGRASRLFTP